MILIIDFYRFFWPENVTNVTVIAQRFTKDITCHLC